jgi:hypothetical protein
VGGVTEIEATADALYLPPQASFGLGFAWARRRRGGGQGGGRPRPSKICAVAGRERASGPWACQKGQIGQNMVRFGQLGAARSRQDELIERRPEEQGTQDAHKSK